MEDPPKGVADGAVAWFCLKQKTSFKIVTTLLLSLVDDEKNTQKMHKVLWPFQRPCGCASAIWSASPNKAQPGLHAEPLSVTIVQLLAPYCPSMSAMVIDGGDTTNTIKKLLASD